jgi:phage terminase large subunit-like protein
MIVRERAVSDDPSAERDPRELELEARKRRLVGLRAAQYGIESFEDYVRRVRPDYWPVPQHLQPLYDLINRSRHEQVFALVSMPPRHGKTETLRLGLSYRAFYDPACQHAYATFGADLSEPTGRAVRTMVQQLGIPIGRTNGFHANSTAGTAKVLDWTLPQGGGLKATSLGGSITGRGITGLLIIDDPIKGREAADSLAERNRVWKWLRSDILSRLEGGGSVIIVQTRWHEDDPIGRMMIDGPDWTKGLGNEYQVINLPSIHDGNFNPIDEREHPELAQPLWDSVNSRFPEDREAARRWYAMKRGAGEYEWWSLHQGVPRSKERKLFAEDPNTFRLVQPYNFIGKRAMLMLDPASKGKTSSDHSALGAFAMDGYGETTVNVWDKRLGEIEIENPNPTQLHVIEIWKDRWPQPKVIRLARQWQRRYGGLVCGIESDGAGGAIPDWVALVEPKLKMIPVGTGGRDKYTRGQPVSAAWNALPSRVFVPSWVDDDNNRIVVGWDVEGYIRVMKAFTGLSDAEDDVVDITAHAFNRMYKPWRGDGRRGVAVT